MTVRTMRVDDVKSVFSLLREDDAERAVAEMLRRMARSGGDDGPELRWAEFESGGRFVRGGLTSLAGQARATMLTPTDDPALLALVSALDENGLEAGRIIASLNPDEFYWVLPHRTVPAKDTPRDLLIVIAVTEALFDQILQHFNVGRHLTNAERRIAFQLLAGFSLRDAATRDGVGLETKRAQIKSLSAKMQCGGQTDLVRLILGQMYLLLTATQSDAWFTGDTERFVARYLNQDVRLSVRRLSGGRLIRILECGPPDGRPVYLVHGMMFPTILFGSGPHLASAGIRLIIPIRRGYLEKLVLGRTENGDLMEESWKDLYQLLQMDGRGPVPLLAQSYGAVIGLRFAARFPRAVSSLMALSTNLARPDPSDVEYAGKFYGSLRRLSRNRAYAQMITLQFADHYADREGCRTVLRRLFAGSSADREVLDGFQGKPATYDWFGDLHASSLAGVAEDFRFTMDDWDDEVGRLKCDFTFLHGTSDPLTRPGELDKYVDMNPRGRVMTIRGGGHFMASSHADTVWQAVGQWADRT